MNINKLYDLYNNLSDDERLLLLDICIDDLGVVDVNDAMYILNVNRSRIYQIMDDNNSLKIGKHKYLMINKYLNEK